MGKRLLTLKELSEYLQITEEKIENLVKENVIIAYRIGGELLRFRKEQIDAIKSEIDERVEEVDRLISNETRQKVKERLDYLTATRKNETFLDRFLDFFYFYDFYLIAVMFISVLLIIIFRG